MERWTVRRLVVLGDGESHPLTIDIAADLIEDDLGPCCIVYFETEAPLRHRRPQGYRIYGIDRFQSLHLALLFVDDMLEDPGAGLEIAWSEGEAYQRTVFR